MTFDSVTFAKALADDTRQRVMALLCCEWLCVNDIVAALAAGGEKVSQPIGPRACRRSGEISRRGRFNVARAR